MNARVEAYVSNINPHLSIPGETYDALLRYAYNLHHGYPVGAEELAEVTRLVPLLNDPDALDSWERCMALGVR